MAGSSLLVLIDDIAAVLDDVSVMTKVAAKKTAGVLGDDLAAEAEAAATTEQTESARPLVQQIKPVEPLLEILVIFVERLGAQIHHDAIAKYVANGRGHVHRLRRAVVRDRLLATGQQESQRKALDRGVELVVACPGRLEDLIQMGAIDLSGPLADDALRDAIIAVATEGDEEGGEQAKPAHAAMLPELHARARRC